MKSIFYDFIEEFGLQKSTILTTLIIIPPPLKCSSLKKMWELIGVEKKLRKLLEK